MDVTRRGPTAEAPVAFLLLCVLLSPLPGARRLRLRAVLPGVPKGSASEEELRDAEPEGRQRHVEGGALDIKLSVRTFCEHLSDCAHHLWFGVCRDLLHVSGIRSWNVAAFRFPSTNGWMGAWGGGIRWVLARTSRSRCGSYQCEAHAVTCQYTYYMLRAHTHTYTYTYTYTYMYIYIYMYACVCVCVCVCARREAPGLGELDGAGHEGYLAAEVAQHGGAPWRLRGGSYPPRPTPRHSRSLANTNSPTTNSVCLPLQGRAPQGTQEVSRARTLRPRHSRRSEALNRRSTFPLGALFDKRPPGSTSTSFFLGASLSVDFRTRSLPKLFAEVRHIAVYSRWRRISP